MLGLVLGIRHATDPDHVIAITTIVSRERRLFRAARLGLYWGIGHTVTVLAVGIAIIGFEMQVPLRVGLAMEFAVALVLVALGLRAAGHLLRIAAIRMGVISALPPSPVVVHSHPHRHAGLGKESHTHVHAHSVAHEEAPAPHEHLTDALSVRSGARTPLTALGVGLVHGLAGSAAIALLVLGAIPDPLWAVAYLGVFCLGVIVGMVMITTAISAPFVLASRRIAPFHEILALGAGLLSFGFGLILCYQIAFIDRLFGTSPIWFPQ
jgi:high-affinity nickel-transport protein